MYVLCHLRCDFLDHAGQIVVLSLSLFLPGREPSCLTVVVVIAHRHLGTNQQNLPENKEEISLILPKQLSNSIEPGNKVLKY